MDKKILILLSLFVLIFSLGCTSPNAEGDRVVTVENSNNINTLTGYLDRFVALDQYTVEHTRHYTSSGGIRTWDIVYAVDGEKFISCSGSYIFSGIDSRTVPCTLEALQMGEEFGLRKTMWAIVSELKALEDVNARLVTVDDLDCFHWGEEEGLRRVACFTQDGAVVSYGGDEGYGGGQFVWLVQGYELE